jgi:hypothetical protein
MCGLKFALDSPPIFGKLIEETREIRVIATGQGLTQVPNRGGKDIKKPMDDL